MQIDPDTLPDDPATLQRMLRQQGVLNAENAGWPAGPAADGQQLGRRSEQLTVDQLQFGLKDLKQTAAENQARQDADPP